MSDPETGWYLQHRDGVQHGPFRFSDIVAAAKLGNIATDTCLRHETQTLGEWVFAPRVKPIAEVLDRQATPATKVRPARSASQSTIVSKRLPLATQPETGVAAPNTKAAAPKPAVPNPASLNTDNAPTKPEPAPVVRPLRELGYPVPKRFVDACLALFDFRFRSFVTPWIVKILWALCVLGAVLWTGKLGYEHFILGEVSAERAASALGAAGEWQFEPLGDQPFLQSSFFQFLVAATGIFVALLCIRVVCEGAIVLFRAATDLNELKDQQRGRL